MPLKTKVLDRVVNPPRATDPDRLREAVTGKTVLVTGASYGLGEATARKLAAAGATVLVAARTAERLEGLTASITAGGGTAHAYPVDLTNAAATTVLTDRITAEHGPLDIVVNNAGKSIRRSLDLQYDRPQDFQRSIDINYLGPIRLLLGLLPAMRAAGGGQIVNISTIGVRIAPGPRWGAYQASKGAFDIWLRSVAPELHADGVAVSSVYMALIHTRMSAPTPIMHKLPGLSPDAAADIVARAIIERPRTLQPWWAWPAHVGSALAPGPIDRGMRLMHRHSADSHSAQGGAR
ncbi:SDR family NAD(P)-dependent oxidoreductase [Nocardia otitidiscaviarum]|uniref:SDR family NAD(P)-dependent oxidoreductase n=1 Tax=Nocardia otitidiscaviarum TaxID=1823 RepID=UPI0004A6B323|nr:SDR family NAD(P)-dependent oxidoreductase [Nocardia otitidiscaviarum]MBF6135034.1 SDR family NAD(P)-dependent oxidoreductase [Nocardia otitidiscaviarum]MBF6486857.1 SDR family NAD(P)-dependent oxidoreductase [Nocardia otitidiscaviarum]